jgi:predicted ATP-dependent endonuclease of OLD family
VDPLSVRRFVRRGGGIDVQRIRRNTLNAEETRKSKFHVHRSRGELPFARCSLMVEGETETVLFAGAAEGLKLDLESALRRRVIA